MNREAVTRETYEDKQLISGKFTYHVVPVTIAAGADLERGAILGKVTATGKYKLSAAAATDGSQTPVVILVEDAAAEAEDTEALVMITGSVVDTGLIYGAGHSHATVWEPLSKQSIYIVEVN